jgi:hypothetical protein
VKLAFVCAMLLGLSGLSAAATDERELSPPSVPTLASTPVSLSVAVAVSTPDKTVTALPDAPVPAEFKLAEPMTANALPSSPGAIITSKTVPKTHKFFDAPNSLGLASMAASLTADALSTQKALAYPGFYEMNPVARPFVQTRSGAAAYTGGAFALLAGTMYVAHKTHHHKLERILPFAVAGWEGLVSVRNYRVIANRR